MKRPFFFFCLLATQELAHRSMSKHVLMDPVCHSSLLLGKFSKARRAQNHNINIFKNCCSKQKARFNWLTPSQRNILSAFSLGWTVLEPKCQIRVQNRMSGYGILASGMGSCKHSALLPLMLCCPCLTWWFWPWWDPLRALLRTVLALLGHREEGEEVVSPETPGIVACLLLTLL